ncbi:uncharacterized protein [Salmo salar]|uniref:Uncharacterized protein n=1 Tax=Salmo salar TaxID=8030 RepID=A0ABM3EA76_SALSA|nr:uncharacterized protein LOC123732748 [Salmo salar]
MLNSVPCTSLSRCPLPTGQKPNITVSLRENLIITCLIPGSVSYDTTCNLYVGEQSKRIFRAHIRKTKHTDSKCWFCQFAVAESDLIRRLQSVRSKEVSCDYGVSSGPNSLSQRSDAYNFTDLTVSPTLTTDTPKSPTERGQSSTDSVVNSNSQKIVLAVQLWQTAVGMASGVGVFLMGLTRKPILRGDLVMGAMSSAGMLDSRDAGIYSLITYVPSTFLPSGPVQQYANDADSENAGVYSLITSVPFTSVPPGLSI